MTLAQQTHNQISHFTPPHVVYGGLTEMGSPQILICGESGGNGRSYQLAEWFGLLRPICRTRQAVRTFRVHRLLVYIPRDNEST